MDRINTSPKNYVVFDVETNGLRSKYDDLLSISFYKPDDKKIYNKFLPLEFSKTRHLHMKAMNRDIHSLFCTLYLDISLFLANILLIV